MNTQNDFLIGDGCDSHDLSLCHETGKEITFHLQPNENLESVFGDIIRVRWIGKQAEDGSGRLWILRFSAKIKNITSGETQTRRFTGYYNTHKREGYLDFVPDNLTDIVKSRADETNDPIARTILLHASNLCAAYDAWKRENWSDTEKILADFFIDRMGKGVNDLEAMLSAAREKVLITRGGGK